MFVKYYVLIQHDSVLYNKTMDYSIRWYNNVYTFLHPIFHLKILKESFIISVEGNGDIGTSPLP